MGADQPMLPSMQCLVMNHLGPCPLSFDSLLLIFGCVGCSIRRNGRPLLEERPLLQTFNLFDDDEAGTGGSSQGHKGRSGSTSTRPVMAVTLVERQHMRTGRSLTMSGPAGASTAGSVTRNTVSAVTDGKRAPVASTTSSQSAASSTAAAMMAAAVITGTSNAGGTPGATSAATTIGKTASNAAASQANVTNSPQSGRAKPRPPPGPPPPFARAATLPVQPHGDVIGPASMPSPTLNSAAPTGVTAAEDAAVEYGM